MVGIIICLSCIIIFMGWRLYRSKRDIYAFENKLESCLDDMIFQRPISGSEDIEDTLWSKVYEKLQRIQEGQHADSLELSREKEAIQQLISDVSHQTKTPMANMKMYIELLSKEEALSSKEQTFLKKIEKQADKLDFLLQSTVKISRLETGMIKIHQEKAPLFDTLGCAIGSIVPKAEQKQIMISVNCPEELHLFHDKKWTEEALFNILDNAVKYTDPGGAIHINVCPQEVFTKVSIADSGKGIALERQGTIFTRFYREPEVHNQEGIGVGLCLSREILHLQKGYIQVRSQIGKGSDFQLFFPNN